MRLDDDCANRTQPADSSSAGWQLLLSTALCFVTGSILLAGLAGYMPTWWHREGHFEAMSGLLVVQVAIMTAYLLRFWAERTGSQRLVRAHDLLAKITFVTVAVVGAVAFALLSAVVITMLTILGASFFQVPDANPLRSDWAIFLLAGFLLVLWLAAAVLRHARTGRPYETFAATLLSSAQLPALLVLVAMKAIVCTAMLVIGTTVWVTGWWSSWIEAHRLAIGITAIVLSLGAIWGIYFAPLTWRNNEPRRLVDGAWIVFLSLSGLTVTVLVFAVAVALGNNLSQ